MPFHMKLVRRGAGWEGKTAPAERKRLDVGHQKNERISIAGGVPEVVAVMRGVPARGPWCFYGLGGPS